MALRDQVLPDITATQDANNRSAFATYGRDVAFGQLYLIANGNRTFVGGMQSRDVRETNDGQFMGNQGNDWLEPRFGLRQWRGSCTRWVQRTQDLMQIVAGLYGHGDGHDTFDVDWRQLPMEWHYLFNYQSITGVSYEQFSWNVMALWITDYRIYEPDQTGKQMEDFTWIGKGYQRTVGVTGSTSNQMQNNGSLWFSAANPPPSGNTAPSAAPSASPTPPSPIPFGYG